MPNWCSNELHIFGESEDIKQFMEANKGLPARYPLTEEEKNILDIEIPTEPRFSFNTLVPTPQEVLALGYDGHEKLKKIAEVLALGYDGHEKLKKIAEVLALGYDGHEKLKKIAEDQGEEAITDMIDGYHWNIANWGTKWDIYSYNLSLENCGWEEGLTEFILYFDTAWSPPIAWLVQVAPKFPKLRFELHYAEPGCCFAGEVTCEGDSVEENPYDEATCIKMFGYAEDCEEE